MRVGVFEVMLQNESQNIFFREFDREKKQRYTFEVYATDSGLYGPRTRSVRVEITIEDVNDNAPVFTEVPFKADISQSYSVGQQVTKV